MKLLNQVYLTSVPNQLQIVLIEELWNSQPKQLRQLSAHKSLGNQTNSTSHLALSSRQFR